MEANDRVIEEGLNILSRREFCKLLLQGLIVGDVLSLITPEIKPAVAAGEIKKMPVIMIECGSCTGDSVALYQIWSPNFRYIITHVLDWRYDLTIMQCSGKQAYNVLLETYEKDAGEYALLVQGSIVQRDEGHYNHVIYEYENDRLVPGIELVRKLALKAKYVVAVGTCATFGGPPSGYPNPSKVTGVQNILPERKVINVSGCPAHPDWTLGTLMYLALYGEPELDNFGRPKLFFGKTIHSACERRSYYDQGIFATNIGQQECLYRVGCKGPVTFADCPNRNWNDFINWPVGCNSPCIGCTEPGFPERMSPFFSHLPDIPFPGGTKANTQTIGLGVLGASLAAIAAHFGISLYNGRLQKNLLETSIMARYHKKVKKPKKPHQYRLKTYIPYTPSSNQTVHGKGRKDK